MKNIDLTHDIMYIINFQKNIDLDTMTFFIQNLDPLFAVT